MEETLLYDFLGFGFVAGFIIGIYIGYQLGKRKL